MFVIFVADFKRTKHTIWQNMKQTVLTRKNTITGRAYKEDPTIFSWELINEPRCNDSSGSTILQVFLSPFYVT